MKQWNVLIPVVALIDAETAEEAITRLREILVLQGFDPYEGAESNAFESEDQP